ncbi:GNAT family N-acetyltransferase [Bacillus sp. FJAT-27445]|uniref:GNAT family N-acetyltransferase n=1 Tax=Bacillus sp. FJAT-27445 TaxID=1679166 RepID=UPI000AEF528E|nr:GNAT family N-acetyltransferase [Bacillus sp. FJAT-27445]
MKKNIEIRPATVKDVSELYELMRQYIVDFYEQPGPEENKLKGLINHLLENPSSGLQFVAEENGELIGFATLYFTLSTLKVKRQAILNDLFVVSKARGKKVGEKLFQASLEYIRKNNFASMTWETSKDNLVAQSLYEKMGGKQSEWLVYEIN